MDFRLRQRIAKSAMTIAAAASSLKHGTRTARRIDDGIIAKHLYLRILGRPP
jgi:hypothetical protein